MNSNVSKGLIPIIAGTLIVIIITVGILIKPGKELPISYVVEKAFTEIDAYHGILTINEINPLGEKKLHSVREVWADKEGRYYIKEQKGVLKNVITVNNGVIKWQERMDENKMSIFSVFPDRFHFTFEIGQEIETVKRALDIQKSGEEIVEGKDTLKYNVTQQGGDTYLLWVDKETNLPIKKYTTMANGISYEITYNSIEFTKTIPQNLLTYVKQEHYTIIRKIPEQFVDNLDEAKGVVGFTPTFPTNIPKGYSLWKISIVPSTKTIQLYYSMNETVPMNIVLLIEKISFTDLIPKTEAVLGNINGTLAEILLQMDSKEIGGIRIIEDSTNIQSIRWQQEGVEFKVVSSNNFKRMKEFVREISGSELSIQNIEEHWSPVVWDGL